MDRSRIRVAMQLLAKAESTNADAESVALVERSYRLLADVITKYDQEHGSTMFGPRRRERRFLRDRRADRRGRTSPPPVQSEQRAVADDPVARYRIAAQEAATGIHSVDLKM